MRFVVPPFFTLPLTGMSLIRYGGNPVYRLYLIAVTGDPVVT